MSEQIARRRPGRGRRAAGGLLVGALGLAATSGVVSAQDFEFSELPTSALLELYTDVGEVLKQRELLPASWNPPQDYAEKLVVQALELKPGTAPASAEGAGGVKYRIIGLRIADADDTASLSGLGKPAFDRLAVVVFLPDYQIAKAAVLPKDLIAAEASDGALALSDAVLDGPGVENITASVYRFAGDDF